MAERSISILRDLGLNDWQIVYNDDPWCNWSNNTIYVYRDDAQCLLHEAAHALIGGGHRRHFWNMLEAMIDYYLSEPLNRHQYRMKLDYLSS